MGKYKLWLHHQEIGRRLRDQISTLEQERTRVQKMAPAHATSLPELENPVITALLSYTQAGNRLSNIDVIQAAMPPLDNDPDQRQPALSGATTAVSSATAPVAAAPAADEAVVARLLARAEQMSGDPLEQMQALARSREAADYTASSGPTTAAASAQAMQTGASAQRVDSASTGSSGSAASAPSAQANSVGGWWQRRQNDDD